MKNLRKVIAIFCLLISYAYFINIYAFPSNIIVYKGEKLNYRLCPFLSLKGDTKVASQSENYATYDLNLSFGDINLKQVELTVAESIQVVPLGQMVGLKLYSDGVMIVGFSNLQDISGNELNISDTSDLREGDRVIKINGKEINEINDLRTEIKQSNRKFNEYNCYRNKWRKKRGRS